MNDAFREEPAIKDPVNVPNDMNLDENVRKLNRMSVRMKDKVDLCEVSHKLLGYFILKYTKNKYYKSGWAGFFGLDESPIEFEEIIEHEKLVRVLPRQIFEGLNGL